MLPVDEPDPALPVLDWSPLPVDCWLAPVAPAEPVEPSPVPVVVVVEELPSPEPEDPSPLPVEELPSPGAVPEALLP